tara:strand:- start:689 stop:853 length:165 start_codon:yes stop_codon:yes gene_type:complete
MDNDNSQQLLTDMAVMHTRMQSLEKRLHRLEMILIALIGGYVAFTISIFTQIIT